jgi:hypothetical protein
MERARLSRLAMPFERFHANVKKTRRIKNLEIRFDCIEKSPSILLPRFFAGRDGGSIL